MYKGCIYKYNFSFVEDRKYRECYFLIILFMVLNFYKISNLKVAYNLLPITSSNVHRRYIRNLQESRVMSYGYLVIYRCLYLISRILIIELSDFAFQGFFFNFFFFTQTLYCSKRHTVSRFHLQPSSDESRRLISVVQHSSVPLSLVPELRPSRSSKPRRFRPAVISSDVSVGELNGAASTFSPQLFRLRDLVSPDSLSRLRQARV